MHLALFPECNGSLVSANCVPRDSYGTRGTNTPSRTDCVGYALHTIYLLKVFVSHFAMVPGWVVLGEIVSEVELAGGPFEIELALVDAILHPPIPHVEGLG
jgi:hypothetical protein